MEFPDQFLKFYAPSQANFDLLWLKMKFTNFRILSNVKVVYAPFASVFVNFVTPSLIYFRPFIFVGKREESYVGFSFMIVTLLAVL